MLATLVSLILAASSGYAQPQTSEEKAGYSKSIELGLWLPISERKLPETQWGSTKDWNVSKAPPPLSLGFNLATRTSGFGFYHGFRFEHVSYSLKESIAARDTSCVKICEFFEPPEDVSIFTAFYSPALVYKLEWLNFGLGPEIGFGALVTPRTLYELPYGVCFFLGPNFFHVQASLTAHYPLHDKLFSYFQKTDPLDLQGSLRITTNIDLAYFDNLESN